jgi:hypothetical protein
MKLSDRLEPYVQIVGLVATTGLIIFSIIHYVSGEYEQAMFNLVFVIAINMLGRDS